MTCIGSLRARVMAVDFAILGAVLGISLGGLPFKNWRPFNSL